MLRKLLGRRVISSILLVGVVAFASNWIYRYQEISTRISGLTTAQDMDVPILSVPSVTRWSGGLPWKYYVACVYSNGNVVRAVSPTRLLGNVAIWCMIVVVILIYEGMYQLRSEVKASQTGIKLRLSDFILMTAVLALAFSYYRTLQSRVAKGKQLETLIARSFGRVAVSISLPMPIGKLIPESLHPVFARITAVGLHRPNDEVVSAAASIPLLTSLLIGGDGYSLDRIDPALQNPMLADLRISGRTLDAATVAKISQAKQIQSLNLARTNISAEGLQALGVMPNLFRLGLKDTPVQLQTGQVPECFHTVSVLELPREEWQSGNIELADLPNLQALVVDSIDAPQNPAALQIRLVRLPQLRRVQLESLQLVDLHLEDLPALESIETLANRFESRTSPNQVVAHDVWVRNFKISATPQLKTLQLYDGSLDEIKWDDLSKTKLSINSNVRRALNRRTAEEDAFMVGERGRTATTTKTSAPKKAWGQGIAKSGPIETLELLDSAAEVVDYASLKNNPEIKRLNLKSQQLKIDDLRLLDNMPGLEELKVSLSSFNMELSVFIKQFPDLRRVYLVPKSMTKLRLSDFPNLETISVEPSQPLIVYDEVQLINMNRFRESLDLRSELKRFHIENVESLRGLTFHSPMPSDGTIRNVRDLQYFAAGGANLNNEIFDEVVRCRSLKKLTLAYSSITPDRFAKIDELKELEYLAVTGPEVNDDVLKQWSNLGKLKVLRLDDTSITAESMDFILSLKELEHLSLNGTCMPGSVISRIGELKKLRILGLAGIPIKEGDMSVLCKMSALQILDLSHTNLNADTLAPLVKAAPLPLAELILDGCAVDDNSIWELVQARRDITILLQPTDVDPATFAMLGKATTNPQIAMLEAAERVGSLTQTQKQTLERWQSRLTGKNAGIVQHGEVDPKIFRLTPNR